MLPWCKATVVKTMGHCLGATGVRHLGVKKSRSEQRCFENETSDDLYPGVKQLWPEQGCIFIRPLMYATFE